MGEPGSSELEQIQRTAEMFEMILQATPGAIENYESLKEIYRTLDSPEAKVNLGVIAQKQGDTDKAMQLYEQALASDYPQAEAAYNLGREVDSLRIERAKLLGRTPPLAALPSVDTWTELYTARFSPSDLIGSLNIVFEFGSPAPSVSASSMLIIIVLVLIFKNEKLEEMGG